MDYKKQISGYILQFDLKKLLDLDLKDLGLPFWAWINLMICWT